MFGDLASIIDKYVPRRQSPQSYIYSTKNPKEADSFMGMWVKAQNKAITKVTDEFLNNDFSEDDFDLKVDEYTVKFYNQMKNGGNNVYDETRNLKKNSKHGIYLPNLPRWYQHMTNEEIGIYIELYLDWNKRCKGIPNDENIFREWL